MARWSIVCLFVLAAAVACGGGSSSPPASSTGGGTTGGGATTSGQSLSFKETEYTISPASSTIKAGTYTVTAQNVGQFPHDLHIATSDGSEVGSSTVIKANDSATFKVTLQPGTYTIWCAVNAHRSLGMQGTLTVQ